MISIISSHVINTIIFIIMFISMCLNKHLLVLSLLYFDAYPLFRLVGGAVCEGSLARKASPTC